MVSETPIWLVPHILSSRLSGIKVWPTGQRVRPIRSYQTTCQGEENNAGGQEKEKEGGENS